VVKCFANIPQSHKLTAVVRKEVQWVSEVAFKLFDKTTEPEKTLILTAVFNKLHQPTYGEYYRFLVMMNIQ
jgi:hypothetical protein